MNSRELIRDRLKGADVTAEDKARHLNILEIISEIESQYHSLDYDVQNIKDARQIRLQNLVARVERLRSGVETIIGTCGHIRIENPFLKTFCDQAQSSGVLLRRNLAEVEMALFNAEREFEIGMPLAKLRTQNLKDFISAFSSDSTTVNNLNSMPSPRMREEIQREIERLEKATRRYHTAMKGLILTLLALVIHTASQSLASQSVWQIGAAVQIAYVIVLLAMAYTLFKGDIKQIQVSLGS